MESPMGIQPICCCAKQIGGGHDGLRPLRLHALHHGEFTSVVTSAGFGLPQPVTRSNPVTAE
jgi:hypothetical protein